MQQPTENRYSIGEMLMQAIVSTLNELPARQVRALLNAIEVECAQQDQARTLQAQAGQQAAVREQLAAEGWLAPSETPLPKIDGGANGN